MSRCRSTSFYLSPGVLAYFKRYRVWALDPRSGEPVEFTHRDHLHAFLRKHGLSESLIYLGPKGQYDLRTLMNDRPYAVDVYRTCARTVEGRRPADRCSYLVHVWAVSGLQAAGGARQVAEELFPEAGRTNLGRAQRLAEAGAVYQLQVLSAAWRSGLVDDPHLLGRLLRQTSPLAVSCAPDPALAVMLTRLKEMADAGIAVDTEALISEMSQATLLLTPGALAILVKRPEPLMAGLLETALSGGDLNAVRIIAARSDLSPKDCMTIAEKVDGPALLALARNPACTAEAADRIMERLLANGVPRGRAEVFVPRADGGDTIADSDSLRSAVLDGLSGLPHFAGKELMALAQLGCPSALSNPNMTPDMLAEIASRLESDLASFESVHPGEVRSGTPYADHGFALNALEAVMKHPSTPADELRRLADELQALRIRQAQGRPEGVSPLSWNTASGLLAARTAAYETALATNPASPGDVLDLVAREADWRTRRTVAGNLNASDRTLSDLLEDPIPEVVLRAESTLASRVKLAPVTFPDGTTIGPDDWRALSSGMESPGYSDSREASGAPWYGLGLHEQVGFLDRLVRHTVFDAGSSQEALLRATVTFDHERIGAPDAKLQLAALERLSDETVLTNLGELADSLMAEGSGTYTEDKIERARSSALLRRLERLPYSLSGQAAAALVAAASGREGARRLAARSRSTPPEVLAELVRDRSGRVRGFAIENNATPLSALPETMFREHADLRDARALLEGSPLSGRVSSSISGVLLSEAGSISAVRSVDDLDADLGAPVIRKDVRGMAESVAGTSGDWLIEPVRTVRELRDNANYMGNCTKNFRDDMQDGRRIIYKVTDTRTGAAYNASLELADDGRWEVQEVNDRFNETGGINGDQLDPEVRRSIVSLFAQVASDGRSGRGARDEDPPD